MNPEIEKRIKSFNNDKAVKVLFYFIKSLIVKLELSSENEKLALNIRNDYRKRISVNLNSRLVLSLHESEYGLVFQFMLNNEDLSAIEAIESMNKNILQKEVFESGFTDATLISLSADEVLTSGSIGELEYRWLKACRNYEPAQEKSQYRNHHIPELYEMALDETILNKYLKTNKMVQTLFTRLANISQYNQQNKVVIWEDITATRWSNVYSKLNINDQAVFLLKGKVLLGTIESILINTHIKVKDIVEYTISNDDFLRLNAVNPENISTIKANFHPFISPLPIDFTILKNEIHNKIFISFYIQRGDIDFSVFNQNDRIVEINYDGIINWLYQFENSKLDNFKNFRSDLFGSKGKTLNQIAQIHSDSSKSNNIAAVQRMINGVSKDGIYKFNSFSEYYNIIHNKSLYKGIKDDDEIETEMEVEYINSSNLNQILYGPPGTGKTYHSINRALEIIGYDFEGKTREMIKRDFDDYVENGQIVFTTFHQNMSYEDFIEGIKPVEFKDDDSFLKYETKPGIFKELCDRASYKPTEIEIGFNLTEKEYNSASFYKISLGNTQIEQDDSIFEYCLSNNCISLGWGGFYDFSGLEEIKIKQLVGNALKSSSEAGFINRFINKLKIGDYVIVSYGNYKFRAIAKVTGDYYYNTDHDLDYYHFRNVEWLVKDILVPVNEIYNKQFSQQAFYQLNKNEIKRSYFVKDKRTSININLPKNYVLIIDEINRGNVSQIFGELITLIEPNKREGKEESLKLLLPYSKKYFSVPDNLYIIGTMNTADRSVEALDTALRRRFSFEEKMPQPNLIAQEGALNTAKGILGDVSLVEVLETINKRIEVLLNRDHLIGHSYFLIVANQENLQETFYKNIIPLLQEYFYGDYGKIGLVLGSGFIREKYNDNKKKVGFASFKYDDAETLQKTVYEIVPASEVNIMEAISLLLNS